MSSRMNAVNNSIIKNKYNIQLKAINRIDKIQLSVRNRYNNYQQVKKLFNKFSNHKTSRPKQGRIEHSYYYEGKQVQLVHYDSPYCFSILIHDPDVHVQELIRDMLLSIPGIIAYISQVEFVLDLHPNNPLDIGLLEYVVKSCQYLRYSRADSFSECGTTQYQGKNGNVRKGTKGLRCYTMPKDGPPEFAHIELIANRDLIKKKIGNSILRLPIDSYDLDINDFVEYRQRYEWPWRYHFANDLDAIRAKKDGYNKITKNPRSLVGSVRKELIVLQMPAENEWERHDTDSKVSKQISDFLKVKKKLNIKQGTNHFFPVVKLFRIRTRGPKLGYVRVPNELLASYSSDLHYLVGGCLK